METLLLVLPVFAVIATGFVAVQARIVPEEIAGWLIAFAYKICLPALMITIISQAKVAELVDPAFWLAFGGGTLVVLVLMLLAGRRMGSDRGSATIAALAVAMTNAGFVALPVLHSVFGARGAAPAAIANLIIAGVFFPLAIVLMELAATGGPRQSPLALVKEVLLNPMVWSTLVGFAITASGIVLPDVVHHFLRTLGAGLTPAALFAIGASIRLRDLAADARRLAVLSTIKLVVLPLLVLGLAVLFGMSPLWIVAATICAAVPTAKNVYVIAEQYGVARATAAEVISATTLCSIATLPLWFMLLARLYPSAFAAMP